MREAQKRGHSRYRLCGNFLNCWRQLWLLNWLLAQIERILEINARKEVTKAVVEAARESLVIG